MISTVNREKVLNLYPALSGLPADRLAALLPPQAFMHLPAGTQVFAEHQPCQGFPLLLEGSIKVIKLAASGRELMLYRVAPGGSCVTHQQLADELGSVREIVSRLLKGFAAQGLVTLGREQLTVTDRNGLQKLAAV